MTSRLAEILQTKRRDLEHTFRTVRRAELQRFANIERPSLADSIRSDGGIRVIAEIKRCSPSAGPIRADADPVEVARNYVNGQADALSVLTDTPYFGGKIEDLWNVTDFLASHRRSVPVLRKDFTIHPIQILEAAEAGASAILLIVAALQPDELRRFRDLARLAGLDAIFEVHDANELEIALDADATIIGVNNRDLHTFTTDLNVSERLIPEIPEGVIAIAESGIYTASDIERVLIAGADAVLVGEALMRTTDPEDLIGSFKAVRLVH